MNFNQWFCNHNYKRLDSYEIKVYGFADSYLYTKKVIIQECSKCGKIDKTVIKLG